jgi:hypothetical protein
MQNWGVNAEKRGVKKIWSSPQIVSDEFRDFSEFPLEDATPSHVMDSLGTAA